MTAKAPPRDNRRLPGRRELLFAAAPPVPCLMTSRDTWILGGALALAGLAGFAWFGQSAAAEQMPPPAAVAPAPPADAAPAPDPGDFAAPLAAPLASAGGDAPKAARVREATQGWTKGVVKGDIQLAVSVLDRIQSISVVVEEARSEFTNGTFHRPTKRIVPVARGRGTPTFEVQDVPFSEYPYVVSVYSPGLNGSRCTVTVDANTPLVDDIVLAITPGTPLTLLVRDQDQAPFVGVEVAAIAVGEPAGRPSHKGVSDNFGAIVFENVLAGDYQLLASLAGQPLVEPRTISVPAGGRSSVRPHSHTLLIERGIPVHLQVHDAGGYPVVGAKVVAIATDRIKLTTYETATDHQGNASFSRLQPGTWQLTVTMDRWQLWDTQRTLQPHQDPLHLDVKLVPLR